ncbi:2-hydroxyacid dehydrogenase [Mangrovicella endophytica]|uniref:2-hydroxyacid dehydrogenase n=1 Tax=Mangrovicella endophytica TaxID=2066697 RepID=UPI000C9E94F3|nr:glyoxylate/hydroxypyruvate reductase A [Mangrovicella endophytica]
MPILLSIGSYDPQPWLTAMGREAPEETIVLAPDGPEDPSIEYAVVWKQPRNLLTRLPNLKAIFSLGAGVDHILADDTLPDVPILRIVAEDLTNRMSEYVVWRVLDHTRQGRLYRERQTQRLWGEEHQPAAHAITVGLMGIGALGQDAAAKLRALGFQVAGWSRTPKHIDGITCYSGPDGLAAMLGVTDILVVLLPLTEETRGILDTPLFEQMKRQTPLGAPVLINAGRGGLQNEGAILRALDGGRLSEVSLDVFETEPLPAASPLWSHPRVFVTPHAAAASDPDALSSLIMRQIANHRAGEPLKHAVDRSAGY